MSTGNPFRATRKYHDSVFNTTAVKLLPNEFYVTEHNLMLTTLLGSCVAACLRDPVAGIGGMNHFMLPESGDAFSPASASIRYGAYAMELLINELLKAGACRRRLEAKVFGGGAVLSVMQQTRIGQRNADFVLQYLDVEGIPIRARDLNGTHARRINYFPLTGQAMVRKLSPRQRGEALVARRELAVVASLTRNAQQPREKVPFGGRPARAW